MRRRVVGMLVAGTVALSAIVVAVGGGENFPPAPTPTATATGTPTCEASSDCFPKPQGSALAGVAGIPPGTSLTACGSDATISTPNAVIDGCTYTGSLTITADNVTIRNSRIKGSISNNTFPGPYHSFTVQDSDIGPDSGCSSAEALIGASNYTARRNYVHGNGDGFRAAYDGNLIVQDNFILLCSNVLDHSDGIQGFGATQDDGTILVDHNTFDQRPAASVTAPVFFADNSEGATITNNLLLAINNTSKALKLNDDHSPDVGPWVVTGNRMIGVAETINSECTAPKWTWTNNRQVTVNSDYTIATTGSVVNC